MSPRLVQTCKGLVIVPWATYSMPFPVQGQPVIKDPVSQKAKVTCSVLEGQHSSIHFFFYRKLSASQSLL